MTTTSYTFEDIAASELEVDRRVQRDDLRQAKVAKIEREFNEDAVGIITVSRRKDRGLYIIDGWHRTEAAKRKDPTYLMPCHVFEGLTLVEEALMFLQLNYGDKPSVLEKYKVSLSAEDEDALLIERITTSHGWKVSPIPAPGHINAINALYRIHELSKKVGAEPTHLLEATLIVITRAWGNDRYASQAVILEGIARVIAEYGDRLNFNTLIERLRDRKGGPRALRTNAQQVATARGGSTVNAVAELIVVTYNKGAKGRALRDWGRKS